MPNFEYRCQKCGKVSEVYVVSGQVAMQEIACGQPECDGVAKKIISRLGGIVRIGGGWGGQ